MGFILTVIAGIVTALVLGVLGYIIRARKPKFDIALEIFSVSNSMCLHIKAKLSGLKTIGQRDVRITDVILNNTGGGPVIDLTKNIDPPMPTTLSFSNQEATLFVDLTSTCPQEIRFAVERDAELWVVVADDFGRKISSDKHPLPNSSAA